jgi:hypothetical protein
MNDLDYVNFLEWFVVPENVKYILWPRFYCSPLIRVYKIYSQNR